MFLIDRGLFHWEEGRFGLKAHWECGRQVMNSTSPGKLEAGKNA